MQSIPILFILINNIPTEINNTQYGDSGKTFGAIAPEQNQLEGLNLLTPRQNKLLEEYKKKKKIF